MSWVEEAVGKAGLVPKGGPLPGMHGRQCSGVGFWNARGLMCADRALRSKKLNLLHQVVCKNAVTIVAEVHGDPLLVEAMLASWKQRFDFFYSPCASVDAGGVLVFVQKVFFIDWLFDFEVVVPGRVVLFDSWCLVDVRVKSFTLLGAHNFGLSRLEMQLVENIAFKSTAKAKANPMLETFGIIGDINVPPPFAAKLSLSSPQSLLLRNSQSLEQLVCNTKPFQKSWNLIFC